MGHRQKRPPLRRASLLVGALVLAVTAAVMVAAASAKPTAPAQSIQVGLITKDVTNPFFVKMRLGATREAKRLGASLKYAAGKSSSDNAAQIAAIENMTTAGAKGILITVADAKAENAAIAKARKAGVLVIALDSPTTPKTAVDALFATNNVNAGILIGKYARAATKGKKVTIAMLDEHAGSSVGAQRHSGFLKGFGIKSSDKQIACVGNGQGQTAPSQTAMENCLQKNPDIAGVRNVRAGVIDATSQQYPLKMASLGVAAVVKYAKTGKKASGYTDTGVNLIAAKAVTGVKS